ncbi:MAG: hypothetical protein IT169_15030 [Bryobacterales bacterium]|nr:hypothetical protein [Bryobacterales bacterium]MCC7339751.1 hypothetical protein [Bryobacterales bacterium]
MSDLRTPVGILFLLMGIIVTALGLFGSHNTAPLTDVNVNLYVGVFMLFFGGGMLWLGLRNAS